MRARTVVRVNQARITQGRAKKERKPMTEEAVCVGVDVAQITLDVAVTDSEEAWQFANDDAREKVESWRKYYKGERPHGALGNLVPLEYVSLVKLMVPQE
jgi:transposase InsO family protein